MRARWYATGGIVAVLVVGACSHGSGSDISEQAAGLAGGRAVAPGVPKPTSAYDAGGAAGAPSPGTIHRGGKQIAANSLPLVDGVYKIQVARMTVAVKGAANVATKANEAATITEQAGGEVDQDDRTSGRNASASLLLRVPPDALNDTLTQLSKLGIEKSRSLSTTDVTQKVADVDSRVRSAQDSIARLRVLFQHATKIGDIIALESELNQREADLESLQAQRRALARETSMASISLTLLTAPKATAAPKPTNKDDDNAFVGGLKRGWDGFTAAAAWVAEAIGTLLPFLVLLLALGLALRALWSRLPRLPRRPIPTPAPTPSPE